MRGLRLTAAAAALLFLPVGLSAETLLVPDEYPTIQEAIEASLDGDVVRVAPGTYEENVKFLAKAITVESQSGPEATVIDGSHWVGWEERSAVWMGAPWPGSVLRGFTVTGGGGNIVYTSRWGGGILIGEVGLGRYATIEDCVVASNSAQYGGGIAMYQGTNGTISDTRIEQNHATIRGGGIWFNQTGSAWEVVGCLITENACDGRGGGLDVDIAGPSALYGPDIISCTIVANRALSGAGIFCSRFSAPDITSCIISHSVNGPGLEVGSDLVSTGDPDLTCCDIFGNEGGDWVGPIAGQLGVDGNICADPLYCGSANPSAPYELHENSPCVDGATPGCGLIGAFPAGCSSTPTEDCSWGKLKALYR